MSTSARAVASTSQALDANEYCVWLATVETTLRARKGSIGQAAMPASVSRSAFSRWGSARPRLPGTMITTGKGPVPSGRKSLPDIDSFGIEPVSEIAS
ncbi:MAG: hypothetical protein V3T20_00435 [Gemmatimonadota bacterium]